MGTLGSGNPGGVDRRSLIKKALTAGGVGYVAPLILGTATPASAQVISAACSGPSCDEPSTCGGELPCFCVNIVGGTTACVAPECGEPLHDERRLRPEQRLLYRRVLRRRPGCKHLPPAVWLGHAQHPLSGYPQSGRTRSPWRR